MFLLPVKVGETQKLPCNSWCRNNLNWIVCQKLEGKRAKGKFERNIHSTTNSVASKFQLFVQHYHLRLLVWAEWVWIAKKRTLAFVSIRVGFDLVWWVKQHSNLSFWINRWNSFRGMSRNSISHFQKTMHSLFLRKTKKQTKNKCEFKPAKSLPKNFQQCLWNMTTNPKALSQFL